MTTPESQVNDNRSSLIQLYSTYLVQNAAIVVAASIGLLTDFQLFGKIPDYVIAGIAGGLIGAVIETLLSVLYWQASLQVIGKTRVQNEFDSQDSLPGLDDFYACQARKKLEGSMPGRFVSWDATTSGVTPAAAAVVGAITTGLGASIWDYYSPYFVLYIIALLVAVVVLSVWKAAPGYSKPLLTKDSSNGTGDWLLSVSIKKGRIKEAYANVNCVQIPWLVNGNEQWRGIEIRSDSDEKGQFRLPASLAQDEAEIEINDRGRVRFPREKFKNLKSETKVPA